MQWLLKCAIGHQVLISFVLTLTCCSCGGSGSQQMLMDELQQAVKTALEMATKENRLVIGRDPMS